MSKQHCGMLQVERFFRQLRMFLRHCCRFWQQCRTKFRPFDKVESSKQIERVLFVPTLSKGQNFVRHCFRNRQHCYQKRQQCRSDIRLKGRNFTINSFDIVADFSNKVGCCFDKVERRFDIVAGVDRALRSSTSTISRVIIAS